MAREGHQESAEIRDEEVEEAAEAAAPEAVEG
jgi:hypothetical protein